MKNKYIKLLFGLILVTQTVSCYQYKKTEPKNSYGDNEYKTECKYSNLQFRYTIDYITNNSEISNSGITLKTSFQLYELNLPNFIYKEVEDPKGSFQMYKSKKGEITHFSVNTNYYTIVDIEKLFDNLKLQNLGIALKVTGINEKGEKIFDDIKRYNSPCDGYSSNYDYHSYPLPSGEIITTQSQYERYLFDSLLSQTNSRLKETSNISDNIKLIDGIEYLINLKATTIPMSKNAYSVFYVKKEFSYLGIDDIWYQY